MCRYNLWFSGPLITSHETVRPYCADSMHHSSRETLTTKMVNFVSSQARWLDYGIKSITLYTRSLITKHGAVNLQNEHSGERLLHLGDKYRSLKSFQTCCTEYQKSAPLHAGSLSGSSRMVLTSSCPSWQYVQHSSIWKSGVHTKVST